MKGHITARTSSSPPKLSRAFGFVRAFCLFFSFAATMLGDASSSLSFVLSLAREESRPREVFDLDRFTNDGVSSSSIAYRFDKKSAITKRTCYEPHTIRIRRDIELAASGDDGQRRSAGCVTRARAGILPTSMSTARPSSPRRHCR